MVSVSRIPSRRSTKERQGRSALPVPDCPETGLFVLQRDPYLCMPPCSEIALWGRRI